MHVLNLVRRCLLFSGYAYDGTSTRRNAVKRVASFVVMSSMIGPDIAFIMKNTSDLVAMAEITFPFACELIMLSKMSAFLYHQPTVEWMISTFQRDYDRLHAEGRSHRLVAAETEVTRVTALCMACLALGQCTYLTEPILFVAWHWYRGTLTPDMWGVPFGGLYPWSLAYSPGYEVVYFWHCIYYTYISASYSSMDMQYSSLCRYVVAYWDIFVDEMEDMDREYIRASADKANATLANIELARRMRTQHAFHLKIIKMMDNVAHIESPIIFVQFIGAVLILAVNIFCVVVHEGGTRVMYASQTLLSFLQLFVFCYYGDVFTAKPFEALDGIWRRTHWYRYPLATQRCFVLMFQRMQKPLVLTGFGYYQCTLDMFVRTIKMIFSVITVLQTLEF